MERRKLNIDYLKVWSKGNKKILFSLAVISTCISVVYILIARIFQELINIAVGNSEKDIEKMLLLALFIILAYAFMQTLSCIFESYAFGKIEKKIRVMLVDKILRKKLLDIQRMSVEEVLNRLSQDTTSVANYLVWIFSHLLLVIVTTVLAIIYMIILNWKMALLFVTVIPFLSILTSKISPHMQRAIKKDLQNEDSNRNIMAGILNHMALLQVYGMGGKAIGEVEEFYDIKRQSKQKVAFLEGIMTSMNSITTLGVMIIASGIGAWFVLRGENRVGDLVAMIQLSNYAILPLLEYPRWVSKYNNMSASVKRIRELDDIQDCREIEHKVQADVQAIQMENLNFEFPNRGNILKDIRAEFEAGEMIVITGKSGSGKSTLLMLLTGLYEAGEGKLSIKEDGHTETYSGRRTDVAFVPSENFIIDGSIRDNICMELPYDEMLFKKICRQAGVDEIIKNLPGGEDENISEKGSKLSMGQRQRVAIARAIYHEPKIMLLDEPTAFLDEENRKKICRLLKTVSKNMICIVASHDADVISEGNKIYEIKAHRMQRIR